jgi:hypothetical protein
MEILYRERPEQGLFAGGGCGRPGLVRVNKARAPSSWPAPASWRSPSALSGRISDLLRAAFDQKEPPGCVSGPVEQLSCPNFAWLELVGDGLQGMAGQPIQFSGLAQRLATR